MRDSICIDAGVASRCKEAPKGLTPRMSPADIRSRHDKKGPVDYLRMVGFGRDQHHNELAASCRTARDEYPTRHGYSKAFEDDFTLLFERVTPGPPGPSFSAHRRNRLSDQEQSARFNEAPRRQPAKIDPRGETRCIEPYFMISFTLFPLEECCHPLPEGVVNCERDS